MKYWLVVAFFYRVKRSEVEHTVVLLKFKSDHIKDRLEVVYTRCMAPPPKILLIRFKVLTVTLPSELTPTLPGGTEVSLGNVTVKVLIQALDTDM